MNLLPHCKQTILSLLVTIVVGCFGLLPQTQAVTPAPDGCYPGFTTAEGCSALQSLTAGEANTGVGWNALFGTSTGNFNTGIGAGALALNNEDSNTAVGAAALLLNTAGTQNTAVGTAALELNDTGIGNTANGAFALFSNTTGSNSTAIGSGALQNNTTAGGNTAVGNQALASNTTGFSNLAVGAQALRLSVTAASNTAVGGLAGDHISSGGFNTLVGTLAGGSVNGITMGGNNTVVGNFAGQHIAGGSNNIYLGADVDPGVTESNNIRIGTQGTQTATFIAGISGATVSGTAVFVNTFGQLGVASSSKRFKDEIKPMDKTSEAILALKPVTFRYKKELDPQGIQQWGLVAEDVQKVNPALVALDKEGRPYAVRYDQVNAMLLNEFLKAHRRLEEQDKRIEELTTQLKQQAAQIQKVSAQLELSKSGPQTVLNNQ